MIFDLFCAWLFFSHFFLIFCLFFAFF